MRLGTNACLERAGTETLQQFLRLSDALVTEVRCAACGASPLELAARVVNPRAADVDLATTVCPVCEASGTLEAI
jgi:hypothetical protein